MSDVLIARVERLERDVNRHKRATLWAVAALVVILLFARTPLITNPTVTTDKLLLVDDNGDMRGQLGTEEGQVYMNLLDASGRPQIEMAGTPHGPFFSVSGAKASGRLTIGVTGGGPYFLLYGANGEKAEAAVSVTETGPSIVLYGSGGEERVALRYRRAAPSGDAQPADLGPSLLLFGDDNALKFKVP